MSHDKGHTKGDSFDFKDIVSDKLKFKDRCAFVSDVINNFRDMGQNPYHRIIDSRITREVALLKDGAKHKHVIMFGSNSYLGLADHPHISEAIKQAVDNWGSGLGGTPHFNGYTSIAHEAEKRLATLKDQEAAMLFSSGYAANIAIGSSLALAHDIIIYDENSHASTIDGIQLSRARSRRFKHNDVNDLRQVLEKTRPQCKGDIFVYVEGVYSMQGDIAPLDKIAPLTTEFGAFLIVDDAHGTGVLGTGGKGVADHFGVSKNVDMIVGTLSKTFATTGGYIASSLNSISYLRFAARSYMFSSCSPPFAVAAFHAALDVLEQEPQLQKKLWDNIKYAERKLNALNCGFNLSLQSAIINLPVPSAMDVRDATCKLEEMGIFVNPVEYPAVPEECEIFRVSISAIHTFEDIDKLADSFTYIWAEFGKGNFHKSG